MLNTVKEIIYTVGDSTGSFAKSIGLSSRDIAKSIGSKSVQVAKDIGPRRALIGVAVIAVAIGGIALVRYFRRREQLRYEEESMQASDDGLGGRGRTRGRTSRTERRAVDAAQSMGR